jgi:type VI secretion system protein ImpH
MYPSKASVGQFVPPSREVVRFGHWHHTAFPASQIQEIDWKGSTPRMLVNFMGLVGPKGVMPLYYSEMVMERVRAKDRTMLAFLDLFNHRMVSLFYQAWEKYRFFVAFERGERDRFSQYLLDLIGLGTAGLSRRQSVPDEALLFYSGLFSLHPRSEIALRQILWDYFDVQVEVEQFVGAWHPLAAQDQCLFDLGTTFSEQLGIGAVVGDEVFDQQSGVRVRLGPMPIGKYVEFLPGGSAYEPLRALVRFYAGDELDFDIQLVLKRDDVPACELGRAEDVVPQLGWSTWVKSAPMNRDPRDTVLKI